MRSTGPVPGDGSLVATSPAVVSHRGRAAPVRRRRRTTDGIRTGTA
ncbi:hypothetical protein ACFY7Y_31965 [Streptomyces virginiae]